MNELKLRPCPFCGSKDDDLCMSIKKGISSNPSIIVECLGCGARGRTTYIPPGEHTSMTALAFVEKAVANWNGEGKNDRNN